MDDVEARVIAIVAENGRLEPSSVTVEKSFVELGLDSLDGASILFAIEDEFDIYITYEPTELAGFTVGQAVEAVRQRMAE